MNVIPKFAGGGGIDAFMTTAEYNIPQPSKNSQQETNTKSSSKKEKDDDEINEKELIKFMGENMKGLPNDMRKYTSEMLKLISINNLIGVDDFNNYNTQYLKKAMQLNEANYMKERFDKAVEVAEKRRAMDEIGIYGNNVTVQDSEGKLKLIDYRTYLNNKDEYTPLTNSKLSELRERDPNFAGDTLSINIISQSYGLKSFEEFIQSSKSILGTSEYSRSGYFSIEGEASKGLQLLRTLKQEDQVQAMGSITAEGLYKYKIIDRNQYEQIKALTQYMMHTAPESAKTWAGVRLGMDGEQALEQLITEYFAGAHTDLHSFEMMYLGGMDKVTGTRESKKSKSGNEDEVKTDPYYNMSRMIGANPTKLTINKGTNYQIDVDGMNYSSIPGFDGKPVGKTSLENLLISGLQGIVTDKNAITFGNTIIPSLDFENIMYDGTGGTMTILPTKTVNNKKVVDLDVLDRWQNANIQLKNNGIESIYDTNHPNEIMQILYQNQLEHLININTGTIDYSQFGQFLVVDGYAVDHSDKNIFKNDSFVTKVENNSDEIPMIEKALSTNNDQNNYKIDVKNWYDWNGYNVIYKGSIYIPITNNQLQALTASGQHVKESLGQQKEIEHQMLQKRLQANKPNIEKMS